MLEFINDLIDTLDTGYGFYNPLLWVFAFIVILFIAYFIRGFGNKSYKKGTDQTQVFLSGNPEADDKELMHVGGKNMYWGFTEALKFPYKIIEKMHTGNVSDYVLWFVIILGAFLLIVGVI